MLNHVAFFDLIVIKLKLSKFSAQYLPQFGKFITGKVHLGKEFELLFALGHEIVISNLIVACFKCLKVL